MGGTLCLANLTTAALPIPSSPALFREDTTYSWSPADERYNLSVILQRSRNLKMMIIMMTIIMMMTMMMTMMMLPQPLLLVHT